MTALTQYLNQLDEQELADELRKCCAAESWVQQMASRVPFRNDDEIEASATQVWQQLDSAAWLEAFAAHPRIGDVATLRAQFANTRQWAGSEQSGVDSADERTMHQLAELNDRYFERFGYIFIISASGKTAREMLEALVCRLPNDPDRELRIAATEQLRITLSRIRKLST